MVRARHGGGGTMRARPVRRAPPWAALKARPVRAGASGLDPAACVILCALAGASCSRRDAAEGRAADVPASAPSESGVAEAAPDEAVRDEAVRDEAPSDGAGPAAARPGERVVMFDGSGLDGWRVIEKDAFHGRGPTRVEEGTLVLGTGDPFTGVAWTRGFPAEDFEVTLKARRLEGNDIFCGLTVPVGQGHVTLVVGGWGNCLVGLSCLDGMNASENVTTKAMTFENDRWYRVALRVTSGTLPADAEPEFGVTPDRGKIEARIDGERVIDLERGSYVFTIYDDLLPTRPAGFFSWRSTAALKDVTMTRLAPPPKRAPAP